MFSQFSKILDRTFIIGYFLPLAAFLAASLWLLGIYALLPESIDLSTTEVLRGTTVFGLITWLGGMILVLLNRPIYQILEGYGAWNPVRLWGPIERRRFERLQSTADMLDKQSLDRPDLADCLKDKRRKVLTELAERFPEKEWILPTSLGNIIRAFEVYPRIMYGLDDIYGWNRLLAVLPKSYITQIDDAKSQTDFWLNLTVLSFLALLEYAGFTIYTGHLRVYWFPALMVVSAFLAYKLAGGAALEWGELIKSAYDVFLPKLIKEAHLQPPKTKDEDYEQWHRFSQAIIYRRRDLLPERQYASQEKSKPDSECDMVSDEDQEKSSDVEADADEDDASNGHESNEQM